MTFEEQIINLYQESGLNKDDFINLCSSIIDKNEDDLR